MLKLSAGQAGDAPHGRELLRASGLAPPGCQLLMDCAYEGNKTRELARELSYEPVVPPNSKRRCNKIESLFRRLKAYWRVFCGFDQLDAVLPNSSSKPGDKRTSVNRP